MAGEKVRVRHIKIAEANYRQIVKGVGGMKYRVIINVDLGAKCRCCGEGGATQNGLCMKCIANKIKRGEYDHILHEEKSS